MSVLHRSNPSPAQPGLTHSSLARPSLAQRLSQAAFLLLIVTAAACSGAGEDAVLPADLEADLRAVSPDAVMIASVDPAGMMDDLRTLAGEVDPRMLVALDSAEAEMHAAFADAPLDPARDISRMLAYASPPSRMAVLARGTFDAAAVIGAVEAHAGEMSDRKAAGPLTYWSADHTRPMTAGVRLPDRLLLTAGPEEALAINRRLDSGGTLQEPMLGLVRSVADHPIWVAVSDVPDAPDLELPGVPSQAISGVAQALLHAAAGGTLSESGMDGSVLLWPRPDLRVADLADLIRGALSAVQMGDEIPAALREMVGDIEVTEEPGRVRISARVGVSELKEMLDHIEN